MQAVYARPPGPIPPPPPKKKNRPGYKAIHTSCVQRIAECQKIINDPSTDESTRERLKEKREKYKKFLQDFKQELNGYNEKIEESKPQ